MISSYHRESAFSVSVYCWTIERKRMPRVVIRVGIKSRHTYLTKNLYVKNVRTVRNSQDSVLICTRLFLLPKEISQYVGLQISRYENDRCEKLRPGVLRFMGSQRVGHDWATDLIWSDNFIYFLLLNLLLPGNQHSFLLYVWKFMIFAQHWFLLYWEHQVRSWLPWTSINIVGFCRLNKMCRIKILQIPRLKSKAKVKSLLFFFFFLLTLWISI